MAREGGYVSCQLYDIISIRIHPQGISNVALVSISLGLDNKASQIFLEAKRNYIPIEEKPKDK